MNTSRPPRRSSFPPPLVVARLALESARATYDRTERRSDRDAMFSARRRALGGTR